MSKRFIFVGNRRFVLQEMQRAGIHLVSVIAIAGTHLARDLERGEVDGLLDYSTVHSKAELLNLLAHSQFDVLVSNGCPYILPVSQLPSACYVNIHPSCLPDLRGVDPVIGSVLYARDAGATCHVMDDGIDTGPIISQVRIPYTEDLDVTTLYQLSFVAEQRAFREALEKDFIQQYPQVSGSNDIYFRRSPEDRIITFRESNEFLLRKIRAFNNRSQGCEFRVNGGMFRVYEATRMHNPFLTEILNETNEGVVAFSYENTVIFRKDGEILRFMGIVSSEGSSLSVGDQLFQV